MAGRGAIPVQLSSTFKAALRRDYVETDRPVRAICDEYRISTGKLDRLIKTEGWPRRMHRPPRDLPPALRLREEARALAARAPSPVPAAPGHPLPQAGEGEAGGGDTAASRIEQLVLKELAAEEAVRAQLATAPRAARDAERSARTLSILSQTLQNLRRLRADDMRTTRTEPQLNPDDDIPGDLDEFRYDLARRIEAFVASRADESDAGGDRPPARWKKLDDDFITLAHPHQEPPRAANKGGDWTTWLVLGGRGAGKTRLGAEWVRALAFGHPPYATGRYGRIALVGETEHDAREVMVEGPAGLLPASPGHERPRWTSSRRRLEWPNGAVAETFSAEDPEALRGPQFDAAWCDELAKWRNADATFDMLQFGLRLGLRPRQLITTTPRPTRLIKRLIADPRAAVTRAPTHANAAFLSPAFLNQILARYAGTRLGRQEIGARSLRIAPTHCGRAP